MLIVEKLWLKLNQYIVMNGLSQMNAFIDLDIKFLISPFTWVVNNQLKLIALNLDKLNWLSLHFKVIYVSNQFKS